MLSPGHAALGYLTTKALLAVSGADVSAAEAGSLVLWGMLWALIPDLDVLVPLVVSRTVYFNTEFSHRRVPTHAPLPWLLLGLAVYASASTPYVQIFGLVLWLSVWSHFLVDSIEYGIMWLWPFSRTQYCLRAIRDEEISERRVLRFYGEMFRGYASRWTFRAEVVLVALACLVFLL